MSQTTTETLLALKLGTQEYRLHLEATPEGDALRRCHTSLPPSALAESRDPCPLLLRAGFELQAYAAGQLHAFTIPLRPEGTPFQCRVWEALRAIPFGQAPTYGEIARGLGKPGAARAVGQACRTNPLLLFIPCHRVIGSDRVPHGFAGGLELLAALTRLERPERRDLEKAAH